MDFTIDGRRVHASTGGPSFDAAKPVLVFLHGAGMDHSVWSLQTRWFAHHGYAVLALDLPGHGRSDGPAIASIESMADWVAQVLSTLDVPIASVIGHSMGSLVSLALASRHPDRVASLALIGTALAMPVGAELLQAAADDNPDAVVMVNLWGHGARAGLGHAETPGFWMAGAGQRLLERCAKGVLSNDLIACNAWTNDEATLNTVTQPVLILQGSRDLMTPSKGAAALAKALPNARLTLFEGAGHMLMVEEGASVLTALATWFGA